MGEYRYEVVARSSGGALSFHRTEEAARERVDLYETIDRRDGTYTPDAYSIEPIK